MAHSGMEAMLIFLDCMAALISAQRLRNEPEVACCRRPKGAPPPEARLRPFGKSLQSAHISGPICVWLAQAAEDLLPSSHRQSQRPAAAEEELRKVLPGASDVPPRAMASQEPGPATVHAADGAVEDVLLVDIDATPSQEGQRGPVPLVSPTWKGMTSGPREASSSSRINSGRSARAADSVRTLASEGASSVRNGTSPTHAVKVQIAAGPQDSAPAAKGLQKASAPAAGQAFRKPFCSGDTAGDKQSIGPGDGSADAVPKSVGNLRQALNALPDSAENPAGSSNSQRELMMGNWVAEQPKLSDPTILSKDASNGFVLPPGSESLHHV